MDLRALSDEGFSLYFASQRSELDVDTLSATLTGFADALRHINDVVDPEFEIEVTIDSTSGGSFKATLLIRKLAKSPWAKIPGTLLLSILSAYLYDLATYRKPTFKLLGDEFIIETSQEIIKLPVAVLEHQRRIADKPEIAKNLKKAFEAVEENDEIDGITLLPINHEERPLITIPREEFKSIIHSTSRVIEGTRTPFLLTPRQTVTRSFVKRAVLVIVKAVLRRSRRKWQFAWNDTDISAPISDPLFFDRLAARDVKIAQGDALDVDLQITQMLEEDSQVWRDIDYEVVAVHGLIESPKQQPLLS